MPTSKDFILLEPHISEEEAFEAEKFLISYYGRKDLGTGCLRNKTNGGEGPSGYRHSETSIKKMKEMKLGKHLSIETREKMSKSKLRNTNSPGWPKGKPRKGGISG